MNKRLHERIDINRTERHEIKSTEMKRPEHELSGNAVNESMHDH